MELVEPHVCVVEGQGRPNQLFTDGKILLITVGE